MLPQLVESNLADRWGVQVLTPAFAFWGGGAVAWYVGQHGLSSDHLTHLAASFGKLPGLAQAVLLIAALMLVSASGAVVAQVSPVVIRLLEGYRWPAWLSGPLRKRAIRHRTNARNRATARLAAGNQLADVQAEDIMRWTPGTEGLVMPTRLGNILRSAEARPGDTYGLDAAVCWPHLWLVLDSDTRSEITSARAAVNAGARGWLWGALFAVWTIWAWWALPVAVIVTLALYYGSLVPTARIYGDLVYAAFALHRFDLYKALHWPAPPTPVLEQKTGAEVTEYLWRGTSPDGVGFTNGMAPDQKAAEDVDSADPSQAGKQHDLDSTAAANEERPSETHLEPGEARLSHELILRGHPAGRPVRRRQHHGRTRRGHDQAALPAC